MASIGSILSLQGRDPYYMQWILIFLSYYPFPLTLERQFPVNVLYAVHDIKL